MTDKIQNAIDKIDYTEKILLMISTEKGEDTNVHERGLAKVLQATLAEARNLLEEVEENSYS